MATSNAVLEDVACGKPQVSESSYNGSAAAALGSVVPYELWSNWNESEVAQWVRTHASLKPYLQCVFQWLGIDGQSMQLLMFVSKSNEYLWKETSLTHEEKTFLSEELCRLLGPPMDKPPLIPPTPTPSSDSTPPVSKKKVTFSDAIDERQICCREPDSVQDFYQSPDLTSKHLQQKVFLAKAASQLRAQLQVFYNDGKRLRLKKSDIDDHVLQYCFDGLGDTLQALVQRANLDSASDSDQAMGPVPQKPQLNETEKNLILAFKHTWRQVPHRIGAPAKMILYWFNDALLRAGLPIWGANGRRWSYVQYKLGLADKSKGWMPEGHGLQKQHMSSPLTPYRLISPLRNDISPIYRNV